MFLIVGLGNVGDEYAKTRHNAGWIVLEQFLQAHQFPTLVEQKHLRGAVAEQTVGEVPVKVYFPHTLMNNSGEGVKSVVARDDTLIVVSDDIDLPIGQMKISYGRGSGGHKGVQSIIDALATKDFIRIRVGIGRRNIFGKMVRPVGDALSSYVLGTFSRGEFAKIEKAAITVEGALSAIVLEGLPRAMTRFN
jgi:peptidyl-tRNA hydrolase, PTH1 family